MVAPVRKTRKRNFVVAGNVKIAWVRYADGRTVLDLRKWRKENQRPTFAHHEEALAEARRLAAELNQGGTHALTLTPADRAAYSQACKDVQAFGLEVHAATAEWAQLRARADAVGRTVAEIFAAGILALKRPEHPVPHVAEEYLRSQKPKDHYGRYRRGLQGTLTKFAAAFPGPIEEVTAGQIEKYLMGLGKGPRRRDNILSELRQFFGFAFRRRYLPEQFTAAREVAKIGEGVGTIEFYTPEETALFLEHVKEEFLPLIAIGAFSGVRPEEMAPSKDSKRSKDQLRWEDFEWDEREISVRAETAKTGAPRRCPILDNLWEWLKPWRDRRATGLVCPRDPRLEIGENGRLVKAINRALLAEAKAAHRAQAHEDLGSHLPGLAPDAGAPICSAVRWRNDGWRHSYGSYRMAIIRNIEALSSEMGNSPQIIKRHYHNPRPRRQAAQYFSLMPPRLPKNVVELPFPALDGVTKRDKSAALNGGEMGFGDSRGFASA